MNPWTLETTEDGIEIVFGSRGYDTVEGYRLTTGGHVQIWHARGPAKRAASALGDGWSPVRAHTALARRLWVVHRDAGGGFLTETGYATALAADAASGHAHRG